MFKFSCGHSGFLSIAVGIVGLAVLSLVGCSGTNHTEAPTVAGTSLPEVTPPFSFPQIPTGEDDVRQGTVVDSDNVVGSGFIDSFGVTVDGSAVMIEAGTTPADITAFAVYQHVARPDPAVPYMVSVIAYYQDSAPVDDDPSEGYYVLYADYSLSKWVTAGLFKTTTTRIQIPDTADVVSPSGFIYTAVVTYEGNSVKVTNVKVGYDDGLGYEQYVLPEVPGLAVGGLCDIELDQAGVPQIAYLVASALIDPFDAQVRVARLVGDVWEIQQIAAVENVYSLDFALGSAGRRALIIYNHAGHQYLLLDTGTGDFSVEYNSDIGGDIPMPSTSVHPAITYINGTDDPLGELDTVLSLYAIPNILVPAKIDIHSIRADGSAPLVDVIIGSGETLKVSDLGLTTFSDNMARVTLPNTGLFESDCVIGLYDAVMDAWGPPGITVWEELNLGSGATREGVMLRELAGGNVVAGYRRADEGVYVFGVWDGLTWASMPSDSVNCQQPISGRTVDFEASTMGQIWFPTVYGNNSPVLYSGVVGDADPFVQFFINNDPMSCFDISLAIDAADTLHLAWQRPLDGKLIYNTLELGEMTGDQVVDYGADGTAMGFGPAPIVADGDTLHIFHIDLAHGQIVYSRNVAGIWEVEQQPVLPVLGFPYLLVQAGVLENTGEVYVGYLDYFELIWHVLISDPNQESWRVVDIGPFAQLPSIESYLTLADDGNSLAAAFYKANVITSNYGLYVDLNINTPESRSTELVVQNEDWVWDPVSLAYNQFNNSWYLALNDADQKRAYLFHRAAPGAWQGPFTIDQQTSGPDGFLEVFGLACRDSDGQLRVFVNEIDHGSTINRLSSLVSDPEVLIFGSKTEIGSVDSTVFDPDWVAVPATTAEGELALMLIRNLIADPQLDVLMFTEDSGVWGFELWDSPVHRRISWVEAGFTVMGNGKPAATLVEDDGNEPLMGRVFVYYPW